MSQNVSSVEEKIQQISHVTWLGFWVNLVLCVGKIGIGFWSNSRVVVADGVHSFSDLLTDVAILVGVRYWVEPADDDHPYGHQRLESLISLLIGVVLAAAGVGIAYDAISQMGAERTARVGSVLAFVVTAISCVSKEWLFRWTLKKGKELKSSAVEANAWDHRSDAIGSLPALLAVGVAYWFPAWAIIDLFGACLVALFILRAAWQICLPAVQTLLDKGASDAINAHIEELAKTVEGVHGIHRLRTRFMGQELVVDLHASVKGELSVREANVIAHNLEDYLCSDAVAEQLGITIVDVLVHIDPELEDFNFEKV